jgi:pyruvate,orthophosphate dikinase
MKRVYFFRKGEAEGDASMKELLGGKGANLAEMAKLEIPVPPGFTITTEVCTYVMEHATRYPRGLSAEVDRALKRVEETMGTRFGAPRNPLLVSIRSGARRSMPGMMETVLNVGLCPATIPGLIERTKNERFVYDAYRRLIMMYADVVMEKAAGIEPAEGQGIRQQLDRMLTETKAARGAKIDAELDASDLEALVERFKTRVKEVLGRDFPDEPREQLWGGIGAVFASWNGKRAVSYRRIEQIQDSWGTAVNVQAMVFGNMGDTSATGVAFTRSPATGEARFYGEWLPNAQGEDVVAGIRTPNPLNEATKTEQNRDCPSLESAMPAAYSELSWILKTLETHFADMLDIEFTIQEGKLWMLQCRAGKRTGTASLNIAMDMLSEKLIDEKTAVMRVSPEQVDELLHPIVDPRAEEDTEPLAKGLPAGPGGAAGQIVFTANDAVAWARERQAGLPEQQEMALDGARATSEIRASQDAAAPGQGGHVILVREETNPEDVEGMRVADGILTARGGMTSHAALVARGWGKCCIVGCSDLRVDAQAKTLRIGSRTFSEGDLLTLNGTQGRVYAGALPMVRPTEDPVFEKRFKRFMAIADKYRRLGVRANADTPEDAAQAREFGAQGIGLFRTEHMFYGKNSEKPLFALRKMIVSRTEAERRKALEELFPFVKKDVKDTMAVMDGLPVTFRLLDPPLHEFVPNRADERAELASSLGISATDLEERAETLHETNPMMGHRGARLGITYPEVSEMQVRAILEAAVELARDGKKVHPEIMIPVVGMKAELDDQRALVDRVHAEVCARMNVDRVPFLFGTMIEIPRACLTADEIAQAAEFFSFGTNDLTQMGFGFSRDDIGGFVPEYIKKGILPADPFRTLDQRGIGLLIRIAIEKGRASRPTIKLGICGEHGGDPASIHFCQEAGLDYVSCSPYRVPVARLAAAHAALDQNAGTQVG